MKKKLQDEEIENVSAGNFNDITIGDIEGKIKLNNNTFDGHIDNRDDDSEYTIEPIKH